MRFPVVPLVWLLFVPCAALAPARGAGPVPKLKVALSTDFGNENHWRRLIEFAKTHDVERLVYWSYGEICGFPTPWSYPRRPEHFLDKGERREASEVRASLQRSARMTTAAGMEFWYVYQVLMLPDLDRLRPVAPELFNAHGEPDLDGDAMYVLLAEQLDELRAMAPELDGLPDRPKLDRAMQELRGVRDEWRTRYPADPFGLMKLIDHGLARGGLDGESQE